MSLAQEVEALAAALRQLGSAIARAFGVELEPIPDRFTITYSNGGVLGPLYAGWRVWELRELADGTNVDFPVPMCGLSRTRAEAERRLRAYLGQT